MKYPRVFRELVQLSYHKMQKSIKLKSGNMSDEYINLREALAYPYILDYVIRQIIDRNPQIFAYSYSIDALGGKAVGAVPLLVAMSKEINKPYFYVRDKKKEHGLESTRDGFNINVDEGAIAPQIILLEDVITTGTSVLEVIHNLVGIIKYPISVFCVVRRDDHDLCIELRRMVARDEIDIRFLWTLTQFRNAYQMIQCEKRLAELIV